MQLISYSVHLYIGELGACSHEYNWLQKFWNFFRPITEALIFCEKILTLFRSFIFEFENWLDCYFYTTKTRTKAIEKFIFILRHSMRYDKIGNDSCKYAVRILSEIEGDNRG